MTKEQEILIELEARRKDLKMPRRVLARRSNLTTRTVRGVLGGQKSPNLSTVLAIAQGLGAKIGIVRASRLSACRQRQARAKARRLVAMTQGSAALEVQAVDTDVIKRVERQVEAELLSGPPLRLWA